MPPITRVPRVIDLSHHNTVDPNLIPAKEVGVVGVIHKLTEGSSFVDSKVQARYALAQEAGMAWGLYHFLRPGDMNQQAKFFVETAERLGVGDDATLWVADHEDQNVLAEQLKTFLDFVEDFTGKSPVVYSGHVLKEQLAGKGYRPKRRLWLAQYAATPTLPEGVERYWLWQYTDQGMMPGIGPKCDLNHFDGSEEEFLRSWAGGRAPGPDPEAPVADVRMEITSDRPVRLTIVGDGMVSIVA